MRMEDPGGDHQRQLCPQAGANQGRKGRKTGACRQDEPAAGVTESGYGGAHGGAEFVGAQGVMDGDAGDEVGGGRWVRRP